MATVFFSYSHKDEHYRDELEKHLALLKRQGVIETWHDRRIGPGEHIDRSIGTRIDTADIILVLVSADFLASDYCHDVEMQRAMERHETGSARVVPIIVRPCDWYAAPFGRLNALPRDGVAISEFPNGDAAFAQIAQSIGALVSGGPPDAPSPRTATEAGGRSRTSSSSGSAGSRFAIKRKFSDLEEDEYLDAAFEKIAAFFGNALDELKRANSHIQSRFKRVGVERFTAVVYVDGKAKAEGSVRLGKNAFGGIAFSNSANAEVVSRQVVEILAGALPGVRLRDCG